MNRQHERTMSRSKRIIQELGMSQRPVCRRPAPCSTRVGPRSSPRASYGPYSGAVGDEKSQIQALDLPTGQASAKLRSQQEHPFIRDAIRCNELV